MKNPQIRQDGDDPDAHEGGGKNDAQASIHVCAALLEHDEILPRTRDARIEITKPIVILDVHGRERPEASAKVELVGLIERVQAGRIVNRVENREVALVAVS